MKKLFNSNLQMYSPFMLIASMVLLGISTVSNTHAQNNPWTQKADMATVRQGFAASMVNDKIYIIGGRFTEQLLTQYDPTTNTWTTKAYMPTGRSGLTSSVVNGKIYAIGGLKAAYQPALATVEEYDPAINKWVTKTSMSITRFKPGSCEVDGKIYVIGGMTSGSNFWSGMHNSMEMYDPVTDRWSPKKEMPTARLWFSTSVVGGKIYAIGGCPITKKPLAIVEEYDPVTDTWTTKTPMPTARTAHAAAVVDGIIYVIGGGTVSGNPGAFSVVEAYNPAMDTWTKGADLPEASASICAGGAIGEKIYICGGIPNLADPHHHGTKTVYEYNPAVDLMYLVKNVSLDKYYLNAGNDSVCIQVKMNDPAGVSLFAMIVSPDQTCIDSIQLFDDGKHNDENAGDSIYSNILHASSAEDNYYVDLQVTRIDMDTVINLFNNMASFTSISPVTVENFIFIYTDTIPNPGDIISFQTRLRNNSSTAIATDIVASLSVSDTNASLDQLGIRSYGDIPPGATSVTSGYCKLQISENCPVNTEIPIKIDIYSGGYKYWCDTFSILVQGPTGTEEIMLQQSALIQNYPNPFSQSTTLRFILPTSSFVSARVYDFLGREVETLVNELVSAGEHFINFDANDLPKGIYFCRLKTGDMILTRKMLLME